MPQKFTFILLQYTNPRCLSGVILVFIPGMTYPVSQTLLWPTGHSEADTKDKNTNIKLKLI